MARPVAARLSARWHEVLRLLEPSPGRLEFAARIALICAIVTVATEFYRLPDPALTVYLVFFLNKPDRATSILLSVIFGVLITILVGFLILTSRAILDSAFWRVVTIVLASFGVLFLTSASKLRPVGSVVALIVGYGLDELGLAPGGELATRGLLYAWLFVAMPALVCIIVNLLIGPGPRRLAGRALANRLITCAEALRQTHEEGAEAVAEHLREGGGEIPAWLRLAGLERTSPPEDVAALRQALQSTVAIELFVELTLREPSAALPQVVRERIAALLEEMAGILRRGAYPREIELETIDQEVTLPDVSRNLLADLRKTLETFAERPNEPITPPPPAPGGFFLPDAFSNPEHTRFALKTTAAAVFCYALYTQLNWPGIHTCFITCYIVGLTTTAETIAKLTLRIAGALIGAAVGTLAIVYVTPHLAGIGALAGVVFIAALAAAWVAVGDERIAYAGFQIAFAFFLCVLQGSTPKYDLATARDRVIGILIGNFVCFVIFAFVSPVSVANRIDPAVQALIRKLSAIPKAAFGARRALAVESLTSAGALERDIDLVAYEPRSIRPSESWLDERREATEGAADLVGPLLFGADTSPDFISGWSARLSKIADRLSGAGSNGPQPPSTTEPRAATLESLVGQRLSRLEQAVEADPDPPEGGAHALA